MAKKKNKKKKNNITQNKENDEILELKSEVIIGITESNNNYKQISVEELIETSTFKMKVEKIQKRILEAKSFNELLDFEKLTKMYKTFYIDNVVDEIDVILYEVILFFKKKLTKKTLSYEDYQKINKYLNNIKLLYHSYNYYVDNPPNQAEYEKMLSANNYIKRNFF